MSLRVKAGIDLEELKKYGFKTGKEWADAMNSVSIISMVYEVKPIFFRGRVREALWRKLRDQYLNVEVEIEIER